MTLTVSYSNRDFTARAQSVLAQRVTQMRWSDLGYCDTATVMAYGDYRDVGDLLELLRCPSEIWDEHGEVIWWGFANSVSYARGSMRITYSLDTMFNSIKVAYSWVAPGSNEVGIRKTTAATTSTDSISFYGTKELQNSASGMTDTSATALRDNLLARMEYPVGVASGDGGGEVTTGAVTTGANITIGLKGWIYTLGWRLASVAKVGPKAETSGTGYSIGDAAANTKMGQTFTVGTTAIYCTGISLYIRREASPTDNVQVEIYAVDGSGNPTGTALLTGATFPYTEMGTGSGTAKWLRHDFTTPYTLAAGTQYIITAGRSGAIDGTNYFVVGADATGSYTGGIRKTYKPTTWTNTTTDIMFRINVNPLMETSQQIKDLIVTYGPLLDYANTRIITASGISTHANREGDTYTLDEILALAEMGYSDGARMVLKVTRGRQVEISKASTTATYKVDGYNRVYNASTNEPIRGYNPPVGQWVVLSDLMPETADTSRLITPGLQYIQAWEWSEGVTTPIYAEQAQLGGALRA